MRSPRFLPLAALLLLAACQADPPPAPLPPSAGPATRPTQAAPPSGSEGTEMHAEEEAAESVANWLLGLVPVIQDGRWEALPSFFSDDFQGARLPTPAGPPTPAVARLEIGEVAWSAAEEPTLTRADVTADWQRFFARWSRFDHLLFKVKSTQLAATSPRRVEARLQLQLVGTRVDSGPETFSDWMTATLIEVVDSNASASPDDDERESRWQLTRLVPDDFRSTVAARTLFTEVSRSTGLDLRSPRFGTEGNLSFNWHGVASADVDGDGLVDLFIPSDDRNRLYRNRGDGQFEDIADASGLTLPAGGTGAVFFDFDADGDSDLLVARVGTPILFENRKVPDGSTKFIDVSGPSGVANRPVYGFSVAVGDVDGDRDLDVFIASYNTFGQVMPNSWFDATNGTPNLLFRNDGNGTFSEIARPSGVDGTRWSYAAAFADYDEDGDQDLYVANDYGPNNLYRNDGRGNFEDVAATAGVLDPGNGMGVTWGDYDGDGRIDLYVMNMSSTAGNRILKRLYPDAKGVEATLVKLAAGNTMFHNNGDGTFKNVSKDTGGVGASWAWGGGFLDFDNDGHEDLYVTNGFISGKSKKDT